MKYNDTIKALEDSIHKMKECGVTNWDFYASGDFVKNILDLINRLEKTNRKNERIIELADKTIETQKAEIERLQNTLDDVLDREPVLVERSEKYAKSEAIKEFTERLKDEFVQGIRVYNGYASVKDILRNIDNLVKEMTENDFKE